MMTTSLIHTALRDPHVLGIVLNIFIDRDGDAFAVGVRQFTAKYQHRELATFDTLERARAEAVTLAEHYRVSVTDFTTPSGPHRDVYLAEPVVTRHGVTGVYLERLSDDAFAVGIVPADGTIRKEVFLYGYEDDAERSAGALAEAYGVLVDYV